MGATDTTKLARATTHNRPLKCLCRRLARLLKMEEVRRRCAAHGDWISHHPEAVALAEAWADRNLTEL